MKKGYITIPRQLFASRLWQPRREFTPAEAYIDLVRRARYDPTPATIRAFGAEVTLARGELCATNRQLASDWKWTPSRVFRFFKTAEEQGLFTVRSLSKQCCIIAITPPETASETASETPSETASDLIITEKHTPPETASETAIGTATDKAYIKKERKEEREKTISIEEEKKEEEAPARKKARRAPFTPPTEQQVADYCREKGLTAIDPGYFTDYYASRGWRIKSQPMRDWRATLRNWQRREQSYHPASNQNNIIPTTPQNPNHYGQATHHQSPLPLTDKQAANLSALALFQARRNEPLREVDGEEPLF